MFSSLNDPQTGTPLAPSTHSQQAAFRIVTTYMVMIAQGRPVRRILPICQETRLSRTTFYNHFEGLEDLDSRFLQVYATGTLGPVPDGFQDVADLKGFYVRIIEVMQQHLMFFQRMFQDPRMVHYRHRWFEIVESKLMAVFRSQGEIEDPALWDLHLEFAMGVVRRYQEISILKTGTELLETVDLMVEYLWGGFRKLQDISQGTGPSKDVDRDLLLSRHHDRVYSEAEDVGSVLP